MFFILSSIKIDFPKRKLENQSKTSIRGSWFNDTNCKIMTASQVRSTGIIIKHDTVSWPIILNMYIKAID